MAPMYFSFLLFVLFLPVNSSLAVLVCGSGEIPAPDGASCITAPSGIGGLLFKVHQILNTIIPVLVALGVVYFVWGVITYVISSEEEAKKAGKNKIIYGIIGLAVIVSLWGLVNIVVNTFDIGGASAPSLVAIQNSATGSACSLGANPKFPDLINYVTNCIINNSIIPLIFALAVVMFVWGVVQFVINSDEEAKKAKGKQFMIWGIVALTVMLGVWGLVGLLGSTFNIDTTVLPQVQP